MSLTSKQITDILTPFVQNPANSKILLGNETERNTHVDKILFTLNLLIPTVEENEENYKKALPPVLSLGHLQKIELMLNKIVALGIYPNLLEGCGLPWELRSKHKTLLKRNEKPNFEQMAKINALFIQLTGLAEMERIMSLFFGDILAVLIQMVYFRREKSVECLESFSANCSQFMLVRGLLQMTNTKTSAPWVKSIASRMLTGVVLRKGGIRALIHGVCGETIDVLNPGDPQTWSAIRRLGTLLSLIPQNLKPENYYQAIFRNLTDLLLDQKDPMFVIYSRINHATLVNIQRKNPKLLGVILTKPENELRIDQVHALLVLAEAPASDLYQAFTKPYYVKLLSIAAKMSRVHVEKRWTQEIMMILHRNGNNENKFMVQAILNLKNVEMIELVLESTAAGNEILSGMFIESFKNYEILQSEIPESEIENLDQKIVEAKNQEIKDSCDILSSLLLKYDKTVLLCKPTAVIEFIEVLLTKKSVLEESTLRILIAALSIIISTLADVEIEVKKMARELVPLLQRLVQADYLSVHVKEMISDCAVALATSLPKETGDVVGKLDALKLARNGESVKNEKLDKNENFDKNVKSVKNDEIGDKPVKTPTKTSKYNSKPSHDILPISECFKILETDESEIIAIRAGAIRSITVHLKAKRLTKSQLKIVEPHLESALTHGDSFLYLSAIQALACFPGYSTDVLISKLNDDSTDLIMKLKISEVLVRVVEKSSNHTIQVLNKLLNLFASLDKKSIDTCPDVVASGLVCLGKLCKELKYQIHSNKFEIFDIFVKCSIGKNAPDVVRHAGMAAIVEILKNLGTDFMEILGAELATKLLRFLRLMAEDDDEFVRMHAGNGLAAIDEAMMKEKSERMEKKIVVLG